MREATHGGSKKNLLGEQPTPELVALLSNEEQVTKETPPTFLVHTMTDTAVPVENSIRYARDHGATLHLLNSDHRMQERVREIGYYFEYFLVSLDKFGE